MDSEQRSVVSSTVYIIRLCYLVCAVWPRLSFLDLGVSDVLTYVFVFRDIRFDACRCLSG